MVVYHNGTPLCWNNHTLFTFADRVGVETIDEALQEIAVNFTSLSAKVGKARLTPKAGVTLAKMFDAAIESGYFMTGQPRPNEPALPFDLVVDPKAVEVLMELFVLSTTGKPLTKTEEKKS